MTTEFQVIDKEKRNIGSDSQEIDQIRKLLFGEFESSNKEKLLKIEERIEEIERKSEERFLSLTRKLEEFSSSSRDMQRDSLVQLGEVISALGRQVTEMGRELERTKSDGDGTE